MPSTVLAVLPASTLVAYLALVLPVAGRSRYRVLSSEGPGSGSGPGCDEVPETDPAAPSLRLGAYRSSIRRQWALAALALALLALAGAPLAELGLAPRLRYLDELLPGLLSLVVLGTVLALVLRALPGMRQRVLRPVDALLPRSAEERRLFVAVALTAGVAEELVFRGFLLVYLTEVAEVSLATAMLISAVLFGLAHSYQGALGVALTGLAGYWLAGLYVLTGSLVLPIVVHALVDLRLLLALPAPRTA